MIFRYDVVFHHAEDCVECGEQCKAIGIPNGFTMAAFINALVDNDFVIDGVEPVSSEEK